MANISKRERRRRPLKPEFAVAGIVIGIFAGEALGVVAEFAVGRLKMWIMLAGGGAGLVLGAIFEAVRYGWRKHKARAMRETQDDHLTTRPQA